MERESGDGIECGEEEEEEQRRAEEPWRSATEVRHGYCGHCRCLC